MHAAFLRSGAIDRVLQRFKYDAATGWRPILGRLLAGWLDANGAIFDYDLIVANPTHVDRKPIRHTEEILAAAAAQDALGLLPFDDLADPSLVKVTETSRSAAGAGTNWPSKKAAAEELWSAIEVRHPERIEGKRILLFDDITTTCHQLRVVSGLLLRSGAASVDGVVLARSH